MVKVSTINKESNKLNKPSKVVGYTNFKGTPMVRIEGNFIGGGFNLSKNKVKAVFDNIDELKNFINGEYDDQIKVLASDQILEVE